MIKIAYEELRIDSSFEGLLKDKMGKCTCKTNISPQLMLKQSYTGYTDKTFVGNWTKKGFWISKYRKQLFQFRPDIIARFSLSLDDSLIRINIRYSIGLSSIFYALIFIFALAILFVPIGSSGYSIGLLLLFLIYIVITKFELNSLQLSIKEKILSGFKIS